MKLPAPFLKVTSTFYNSRQIMSTYKYILIMGKNDFVDFYRHRHLYRHRLSCCYCWLVLVVLVVTLLLLILLLLLYIEGTGAIYSTHTKTGDFFVFFCELPAPLFFLHMRSVRHFTAKLLF